MIHAYAECFLFMTTALNLNPAEQRSWFDEAAAMVSRYCSDMHDVRVQQEQLSVDVVHEQDTILFVHVHVPVCSSNYYVIKLNEVLFLIK